MTTNTTTALSSGDIERLERLYVFRDRAAIIEFLEVNPFLIPLLFEARDKSEEYFPGAPVTLEFDCDPESTEEDCWITALILTDLEDDEAEAVRDRFGDEWWLKDPIERAQMKFNIDTGIV